MDMGKRKGPMGRWDFENEADYEKYMNNKEAMPRAAYQYGLKVDGGRKTRKTGTKVNAKNDEQKLDRQWTQISKVSSQQQLMPPNFG
jgi:IK cytokine